MATNEEIPERTPEPPLDRTRYYPRGWALAWAVVVVLFIWLVVGLLWNPEWWPWWRWE